MWDKGVPCFTESLYTASDTSQHLMCVHPSQSSQEIALLFERTPTPHTVQGYFGVLPPRVAGPGFGCTSPESSSMSSRKYSMFFRWCWNDLGPLDTDLERLTLLLCNVIVGDNRE